VTKLDLSKAETTHRWASFLPDGRHFLYMAGTHAAGSGSEANAVYAGDLTTGQSTLLLQARSNVEYADGYLLYVRENVLVAHPFDARRLALAGDPVPVAEGVQYSPGYFHAAFSLSRTGTLVYRVGGARKGMTIEWLDRQGKSLGEIPSPASDSDSASYPLPAMSSDGSRLAVPLNDRKTGRDDIWIVDLKRGVSTRFTFAGGSGPCWSPDDRRIVYSRLQDGLLDLFSKPADGEGSEELLYKSQAHNIATDWSRDGKTILGTSFDVTLKRQYDLFTLPTTGEKSPRSLLETPFAEREGRFSPDGRWIAYLSDESGADGVYVMPFPGPGGKYQISADAAATRPYWSGDGHAVYYERRDGSLMMAEVTPKGGALEVGTPRSLFRLPEKVFWLPDPAGPRILIGRLPEQDRATPITIVSHWTSRLKH
jgi:WD40 repeat protein